MFDSVTRTAVGEQAQAVSALTTWLAALASVTCHSLSHLV